MRRRINLKTGVRCCLFITLLLLFLAPFNFTTVGQTDSTEIKVVNPLTGDGNFTFYSNMTSIGTRFNATIWLYDVTDLYAHQVKLIINDTLLNITNAWIPRTDPEYVFYGLTTMPLGPTFYDFDEDGVYESALIGDTIMGEGSFTGSGLVAIFELEIIYTPETGEKITELSINNTDTLLLDSELSDIETIKTDGIYKIIGAPAPPVPPATLYVDPAKICDPDLTPSKSFSLQIRINNATEVYAFTFKISYDPTLITIDNVTVGDFFPPESYDIEIDNVAGLLIVSAQLTSPELPRSGDGTLITVYFHVEGIGATTIPLFDTELLDEEGNSLPHTAEGGFFSNVFLAKLSIEPEELISPELLPPHVFSVNVTIDDVENLYSYEFNLTYNTKMLTCIGVYAYPVNNQSDFTISMELSDAKGWLWINVTFYEPAIPITTYTPTPILQVTFIVENPGLSVLHLGATSLANSTGHSIPHETHDGYVQTLIRDVAVTSLTVKPDWVYAGWIVNITVTVKNLGNVSETFNVTTYYNGNLIAVKTVHDLQPGKETIIEFSWNTSDVEEGIYTIKAEASRVPYEFNAEDNILIGGPVEVRTLIRDIAIISLTAYPKAVYAGWSVNLTVAVRNEGNLTESFSVILYCNETVIVMIEILDLAPNEELTITYVWDTTGLPECSNYTIRAELPPLEQEFEVEDNYFVDGYVKIKIYGDINGDGKVDIRDVATVASAFGSYPGHSRWNPEADLNLDGEVNIRDVAIVASNFGRIC